MTCKSICLPLQTSIPLPKVYQFIFIQPRKGHHQRISGASETCNRATTASAMPPVPSAVICTCSTVAVRAASQILFIITTAMASVVVCVYVHAAASHGLDCAEGRAEVSPFTSFEGNSSAAFIPAHDASTGGISAIFLVQGRRQGYD